MRFNCARRVLVLREDSGNEFDVPIKDIPSKISIPDDIDYLNYSDGTIENAALSMLLNSDDDYDSGVSDNIYDEIDSDIEFNIEEVISSELESIIYDQMSEIPQVPFEN